MVNSSQDNIRAAAADLEDLPRPSSVVDRTKDSPGMEAPEPTAAVSAASSVGFLAEGMDNTNSRTMDTPPADKAAAEDTADKRRQHSINRPPGPRRAMANQQDNTTLLPRQASNNIPNMALLRQ